MQMQLKGKEILMLAEKNDRLEQSRQHAIKEMELLRKEPLIRLFCIYQRFALSGARRPVYKIPNILG
jgi:hypothetical protein